jgi:glycosyltransferase involved in cell wall biosynthesis
MPRISVIVPVYNSRPFLDRCIVSILQQSFSDFEAIFIDDCSSDGSASLVRQFARNDSRIVLSVHPKNKGPGAARNTGVAMARADYVTFVDSDDFIAPNLFEIMISASEGGKFDVVETGCRAIDKDDNVLWDYTPPPMKIENLDLDPDSVFLVREWGVTQKLWKRSLLRNDIKFPEGVFWEDIAVVPSMIVVAQSLARVDFIGYNYLQHTASITNSRSVKHILDLFRAFDCFIVRLRKRNIFEKYRGTVSRIIETSTKYLVNHMRSNNRSNPQRADNLILLCEMLATEYLAGRQIARYLDDAAFEAILSGPNRRSLSITSSVKDQFASLLTQATDDRHAA